METLLAHQPIIDVPYEKINDIAIALVKEGYGNISEYKAEIERLKAENETYCKQINQAYDTGYNDGYDSCQDDIKRAKIDVLNELKGKMFEREYMGVKYKERIFYESEIDDMIAEVQNAEDKG